MVNQTYPPEKYFGPAIGGVRGSGAPLIVTSNIHLIVGLEFVNILGIQGVMAV